MYPTVGLVLLKEKEKYFHEKLEKYDSIQNVSP